MEPRAIFIVRASIPPEKEEAFNRWYNEDHFPKAMAKQGIISGRRYKIIDTGGANLRHKIDGEERFTFMAIYEYENLGVIQAWRKSDQAAKLVAEFNAAFPESERLWISAIQIYP